MRASPTSPAWVRPTITSPLSRSPPAQRARSSAPPSRKPRDGKVASVRAAVAVLTSPGRTTGKRMIICYYVSGHGYGHATRACKVISAILGLPGDERHIVHVVSLAPRFIFHAELREYPDETSPNPRWYHRNVCVEPAVVQPKAYVVDREATVAELQQFLTERDAYLAREVDWLQSVGAQAVAVDAPFLPCAAASLAGLPAIVITNFTFDAVYEGIHSKCPTSNAADDSLDSTIEACVRTVKADYCSANALICLPGHAPGLIPTFDGGNVLPQDNLLSGEADASSLPPRRQVFKTPLICRHAKPEWTKKDVLEFIGVPPTEFSKSILLVNFGGQLLSRHHTLPSLPDGWIALVCGGIAPPMPASEMEGCSRFYPLPRTAYIPDVIGAADMVLGKLGYGTVSEALMHRKPFLYVPRRQFIEERGLVRLLESREFVVSDGRDGEQQPVSWAASSGTGACRPLRMCATLSSNDFEEGRWKAHIRTLHALSMEYFAELDEAVRRGTVEDYRSLFENGSADVTIAKMFIDLASLSSPRR